MGGGKELSMPREEGNGESGSRADSRPLRVFLNRRRLQAPSNPPLGSVLIMAFISPRSQNRWVVPGIRGLGDALSI